MSDIGKKERVVRAGKYLGCLEALFLLPSSQKGKKGDHVQRQRWLWVLGLPFSVELYAHGKQPALRWGWPCNSAFVLESGAERWKSSVVMGRDLAPPLFFVLSLIFSLLPIIIFKDFKNYLFMHGVRKRSFRNWFSFHHAGSVGSR